MSAPTNSGTMSAADGFVLIATVVSIMIMGAWAVLAFDRLTTASNILFAESNDADAAAASQDAIARLVFVLATSGRAPCGVQPAAPLVPVSAMGSPPPVDAPCVSMDGRLIEAGGGNLVSAVEDGALMSLFAPPRFLSGYVPAAPDSPINPVQALLDYTDLDDRTSDAGAEAAVYAESGRAPPTNRWLRTPYQAVDVIGWGDIARRPFTDSLGLGDGSPIGVNTAQAALLEQIFSGETTALILAARRMGQFVSGYESFRDIVGRDMTTDETFSISLLPKESFRLRIWSPGARRVTETHLRLDTLQPSAPWSLDYQLPLPTTTLDVAEGVDKQGLQAPDLDRDQR